MSKIGKNRAFPCYVTLKCPKIRDYICHFYLAIKKNKNVTQVHKQLKKPIIVMSCFINKKRTIQKRNNSLKKCAREMC